MFFYKEIFIKKPKGFLARQREYMVCQLKRSLYGLKDISKIILQIALWFP
jgi:hypothetical protein